MFLVSDIKKYSPSFFSSAVLDKPIRGDELSGLTKFSGWVITTEKTDKYVLEIFVNKEQKQVVKPDIPRIDVQNKFLLSPSDGKKTFNGFSFELKGLKNGSLVEVYAQNEVGKEKWFELSVVEVEDESFEDGIRFLSGEFELGENFSNKKINSLSESLFAKCNIFNSNDVESISSLTWAEKRSLESFLIEIEEVSFLAYILESVKNEKAKVKSPFFLKDFANLVGSFFVKGVNYLIFEDGKEYFYIGQYLHTVDFVFFPNKRLVYRAEHSHFEVRHLKQLFEPPCLGTDLIQNSILNKPVNSINLIVNGISPYHFFYDSICNLMPLKDLSALNIDEVVSINGQTYFPFDAFMPTYFNEKNLSISEFEKEISHNKIHCLTGKSFRALSKKDLKILDKYIDESAKYYPFSKRVQDLLKSFESARHIIWIGISGQKRSWTNQVETIIRFCEKANDFDQSTLFLLDGMTSSIYSNDECEDFIGDHKLAEKIISQLEEGIQVKSIVGFNSLEKIHISKRIDFFISNYSTGSIFTSRFSRKFGVTHLSNKMMEVVKDIHIHHNVYNLPTVYIEDIPDPNNPRLDFISYKIDSDAFLNFSFERFCEHVNLQHHRSRSFFQEDKIEFQNVIVTPMTELIQANIGLSTHRGGPIWPNWDKQLKARHYRGDVPVDHIPYRNKNDSYAYIDSAAWIGPVSEHFGHQIAEFSMRLPQTLIDSPNTKLLFSPKNDKKITCIEESPSYFRAILDWFNVDYDQVVFINEPTLIKNIVVFPQAETLHGDEPLQTHLSRLNYFVNKNFFNTANKNAKKYKITYVARSKMTTGKWAGESYLVKFLERNGINVFFPEKHSLNEQLNVYLHSEHLIFAEGSAIHSLQLVGNNLNKVSIFMRRAGITLWDNFVRPRCELYEELNFCSDLLFSYNLQGTPLDASGLTLINQNKLISYFQMQGLNVNLWDRTEFLKHEKKDLKYWLSKTLEKPLTYHSSKENIVNCFKKH